MNLRCLCLVAASLLFLPNPAHGTPYWIDIGGTAHNGSGNTLRVRGVIDVDVDTDIISDSSLFFYHTHEYAPIPLPHSFLSLTNGGVHFSDANGMLFITTDGLDHEFRQTSWEFTLDYDDHRTSASFKLSQQSLELVSAGVVYDTFHWAYGFIPEYVFVSDDNSKLKIGTAIPEPTAFLISLIGTGMAGAVCRVKRRLG